MDTDTEKPTPFTMKGMKIMKKCFQLDALSLALIFLQVLHDLHGEIWFLFFNPCLSA